MRDEFRSAFFLGGHDLEMLTIRELLVREVPADRMIDKGLAWGAKASDYRRELGQALDRGFRPVLIELEIDLPLERSRIAVVDHHGGRAGKDRPTSLHQVFDLLGLPQERWTRWFDLVAANDRGYIPAMVEIGATRDEIIRVRAADRAAQGITAEQEAQGERAIAGAQCLAGGRLTVIGLSHDRTAAVADRLAPELGGSGFENLLILGRDSVHFFGAGRLVLSLNQAFPGGWSGGSLPDRGFWGHPVPARDALDHLLNRIGRPGSPA